MVKAGYYGAKRVQRWKCQQCNERFSEPQPKPFGEDIRLSAEKVTMILRCLALALPCCGGTWSRFQAKGTKSGFLLSRFARASE